MAPERVGEYLEHWARVRAAVGSAGLWDELGSDWLLLDAELMPWNAKAEALITDQYAAVGAAAEAALPPALEALSAAAERGVDLEAYVAHVAEAAEELQATWRGLAIGFADLAARTGRDAAAGRSVR